MDPMESAPLSPSWKRPDEVMKLHRLKQKKKALQARMNRMSLPVAVEKNIFSSSKEERKSLEDGRRSNPFKCNERKRLRCDDSYSTNLELSSDNTLFQLLDTRSSPQTNTVNLQTSFSSVLSHLSESNKERISETQKSRKGSEHIPIDWTLKKKIRLISPKPYERSQKLRTCEEASGITGFVRCLDTGVNCESRSLDTSPNARFHQCCLVWQHPSLPWIELFPRTSYRVSAAPNVIAASQPIKDVLHKEWSESFRSLFQLIRASQCPYFYVCANTFTCLFRAAGILGFTDIHALLTPTTRGFRQILKEEDVEFIMPLKKTSKRFSSDNTGDTGYNTLDSVLDENSISGPSTNNIDTNADEDDDDEPADEWLESMGVAAEEIQQININIESKIEYDKQREVDRTPESLIYVEGVEAQALFNFLLNCKSCIATTGPLAGVPPTLLAPVAFSGATLKSLKVRQSVVKVDMDNYYSMELCGPILPHLIHNLCGLMKHSLEEFSATFANLDSTKAFSLVTDIPVNKKEDDEPASS
ncbi:hypothetical protein L9F63_011034, partial [Diploptera punctata]